ncbi:lasso peptide biosynthesis B2 protein [Streptomyces sp. NPDC002044]|uniref:lasso peptide biosynthesis B2 protein n=1 Tax=Streptomyces sp. NPDC002044 TaxID=3154662 RepID=UPI00332BEA91
MSPGQTLQSDSLTPSPGRLPLVIFAVALSRVLVHLRPRRLRAVLTFMSRGAKAADYEAALRARRHVVAVSTRCAGRYCLDRSIATAVLCRLGGTWPTWCTGVITSPFAAHAWVEAEGRRVGEPGETAAYKIMLSVPAHGWPVRAAGPDAFRPDHPR